MPIFCCTNTKNLPQFNFPFFSLKNLCQFGSFFTIYSVLLNLIRNSAPAFYLSDDNLIKFIGFEDGKLITEDDRINLLLKKVISMMVIMEALFVGI